MKLKVLSESYIPIQPMTYLDVRTDGKQNRHMELVGIRQKVYEYGFASQFYKLKVNFINKGYRRIYCDFEGPPYFRYKGDKYEVILFLKTRKEEK